MCIKIKNKNTNNRSSVSFIVSYIPLCLVNVPSTTAVLVPSVAVTENWYTTFVRILLFVDISRITVSDSEVSVNENVW